MALYQKLCNELKFEIWEKAAMVPGMNFFLMYVDRLGDAMPGNDIGSQHPRIYQAEKRSDDTSAWCHRQNLMNIDAVSKKVMNNLINGPSAKNMFPHDPQDNEDIVDGAYIDCDHDMVCIRFIGIVTAPWARRVLNPELFRGIKRVCMEYDFQCVTRTYPDYPFECQCDQGDHEDMGYCPVVLDKFLGYFPDLEKFYFVKQLVKDELHRPKAVQILANKRDHEGQIKDERNVKALSHPRITRKQAKMQHLKDTYENFRDIARRENLASFEDTERHYYEVRECDTEVMIQHNEIWDHFHKLKELWADQKTIPDLGHPVKEVELGLLVHIDPPQPDAVRLIKVAKSQISNAARKLSH